MGTHAHSREISRATAILSMILNSSTLIDVGFVFGLVSHLGGNRMLALIAVQFVLVVAISSQ